MFNKSSTVKTVKRFNAWLEETEKFQDAAPAKIAKLEAELNKLKARLSFPFAEADSFLAELRQEGESLIINIDELVPELDAAVFAYAALQLEKRKPVGEVLDMFPKNHREVIIAKAQCMRGIRYNTVSASFDGAHNFKDLYAELGKEKDFSKLLEINKAGEEIKGRIQTDKQKQRWQADKDRKVNHVEDGGSVCW